MLFALLFLALVLYLWMLLPIVAKNEHCPRSPPAQRDYEDKRPAMYDDRWGGYELTLIVIIIGTTALQEINNGTRDVLLPGVAAQRRSHDVARLPNSRPATRSNVTCAPTWSGSSTSIPRRCATFNLASSDQTERGMCSYLEWQLNVDPTTLRNIQTCVQRPDRMGDVLLPGVAAQRRSHDVSRLSNSSSLIFPDLGLIHP